MSIQKQLYYLCKYTGLPARSFRHTLVGSKVIDPMNEGATEAHIFTDEGSKLHRTFEAQAAILDITRKWDCKPEPGMPANLCYVVPDSQKEAMEALTARLKLGMQWGILPVQKTLVSYKVPANYCWIITKIFVSTIPTVNNPDLGTGDWRSNHFDATGTAKAWLLVQDHLNSGQQVSYFQLFNRPLLVPFNGGATVKLQVLRPAFSVPSQMNVLTAIQGFLADGKVFDAISAAQTQFVKAAQGG